jgi:RNA polymerase sigma-70 factor (ECF subfamily)
MSKKWLVDNLQSLHKDGFYWALQCCGYNEVLAADILQEVYLKILQNRARFQGSSSLKTWFFSVIRYTTIDYLRQERKDEPLEAIRDMSDGTMLEESRDYKQLINQLPQKQAMVLLLVFYHDMTIDSAAEVIGVSVGTARTHYFRGKEKLREILKKELYEQ